MSNPAPATPVRLEPGQKQERPLAEKETHPYLVRLEAGDYVRIVAEQRGVDLALSLFSPDGKPIVEGVDSPTGDRGAERVSEVATAAGDYRVDVLGTDGTPKGTYEIRIDERHAATDADRRRVEGERVFLAGETLRRAGKFGEASTSYERALALWKEAGDLGGQAAALFSMGWMKELLDQWEPAAELSKQAAEFYRQVGDATGQAQSLNASGRILGQLGHSGEARPRLEEAVRLFRASNDLEGEASALYNLGNVENFEGRFDQAVVAYDRVLTIWRQLKNRKEETLALLGLGDLYLGHGKWVEARNGFEGALRISNEIGARDLSAVALFSLGTLEYREGNLAEARMRSEQSLALYRDLANRRGQAMALNSLSFILLKAGDREGARARGEESLTLFHAVKDARGEAMATANLSRAALARGDARQALALGQDALARFNKFNNSPGLSFAHYTIAQALLILGDPDKALHETEASLNLSERQRAETASLYLRAFYFATRQHYWELYIDVLMKLDQLHPSQGFAARALEADERRRARSLLDSLAEVRAEVRQSTSPVLLREEGEVRRLLEQAKRPEESDELLARLDRVRSRMRQETPHLASVETSETLSLAEIQKRLLDTDAILLVYSLGEERSILWKVTRSTLAAFSLPGSERVETAARLARDVLSRHLPPDSSLRRTALDDLAGLVLKPVANDLTKFRRLLIVADGALQMVPFAALPDPGAPAVNGRQPLLVEGHPIIYLPSASVGATLRQERRSGPLRGPGPLIAVLADPVFDASDPRVKHNGVTPTPPGNAARGELTRSVRDLGMAELDRLPFSRHEAEAIQRLWRPGEVLPVFDFAASRDVLKDAQWLQAPILHFATHSLLDDRQPELSGLVFSLVNPDGTPRTDGFLRLHDIYGLNLKADLVVLSACETGVGKEMRGEGLLGITHGFMSIGVPAMVVSVWKVEDEATAELMARFYRQLYEGKRPPEALQEAQKSMLRESRWSDPMLWAGFIFMGDYDRKPGDGVETRYAGGTTPPQAADSGGLPPPKVKPPKAKPKPPRLDRVGTTGSDDATRSPIGTPSPGGFKFSSYTPSEIHPEEWHTLLAYGFQDGFAGAVAEDSAKRLGTKSERYWQAQVTASQAIATGSDVVIVPELEGCRFNPSQAGVSWLEGWHCAEFRFQAVPGLPGFALGNNLPGRLSFYVNAVLVADISFNAKLTRSSPGEQGRENFRRMEVRPYQSVFISYAHSDAVVVEALEEAYTALGLGLLRDIRFLRPGEEWEPKLLEKIDEADVFQLFWSNRAKRSKWVKAEWQHALELARPFFVRPVYWENPMPRPPKELAHLHFHRLGLEG
jgi:CHAT domain-containing protein